MSTAVIQGEGMGRRYEGGVVVVVVVIRGMEGAVGERV